MENDLKNDETNQEVPEQTPETDPVEAEAAAEDTGAATLPEKTEAERVAEEIEAESGEEERMPEDLMGMYEESFKQFEEGEVVQGRIISVDRDFVLVDIGYKSEGQIPIREFRDEHGEVAAAEGDTVEVMVEFWDDEEEVVVLSKEKAATIKVWEEIKRCYDAEETISGTITNRVKGGFSVDIGVQAFLPGSQADLRPKWSERPSNSRFSNTTGSGPTSSFPAGFFWKKSGK